METKINHLAGKRVKALKALSFSPFSAEGLTGEGWMLIGKASLWKIMSFRGPGASPVGGERGHNPRGSLLCGPHCAGGLASGGGGVWAVGPSLLCSL